MTNATAPPPANGSAVLLPQHLADLARSGLTAADAAEAGLYSESDPAEVGRLLAWSGPARQLGEALVFPYYDADGRPTGYARLKPDKPRRDKKGKAAKYESPRSRSNRLYIPPGTRSALSDPAVPLIITEGEKKALAADKAGVPCVGLVGVYGWMKKREKGADGKKTGPRVLIDDLAAVAWAGRRVFICFDSDSARNQKVQLAEQALAAALSTAMADVRIIRIPDGVDGADDRKVGLDDFLIRHGPDGLRELLKRATKPKKTVEKTKSPPAAQVLAQTGLSLDLWHDPTQTAYVTIGRLSHPVRSKPFRQYLLNGFRKATGKVPGAEALTNALNVIEAAAVHDGPERPVHVRMAGHNGRVYLHLADADSSVVELDNNGWRHCENPPVRFRKPAGMLALPKPGRGGSLAGLRRFLNVPDDDTFALVVGWLVGCFRHDGPFPVMVLLGEQGSAKTTTARVLKRLIDPSAAEPRSEPREVRDLMIQGRNNWVLAFDNLSGLPGWLSDSFCRLATGGGFSTRELYSDCEEMIFDAKRPLLINGIEDFVTRADLLERSILVRHPPIPEEKRRPEAEFWAEFESALPHLLGAVLDRVSAGLRELPRAKLDRLPRMADFALFAAACERGAGDPAVFLSAYAENQAGAHEQALDASPLPTALLAFLDGKPTWEGKPTELLAELDRHAPDPPPKDWPKRANVLTNRLRRIAPNLRRVHGLDVDCDVRLPDRNRTKVVRITRRPESGRETPSASSAPSADDENALDNPLECGRSADGPGRSADDPGTPGPSAPNPGNPGPADDADDLDDEFRTISGSQQTAGPDCVPSRATGPDPSRPTTWVGDHNPGGTVPPGWPLPPEATHWKQDGVTDWVEV